MTKIVFRVTLADELVQPFMQMIRDFDVAHDPMHENKVLIESMAETDWSQEQWLAMMQAVNPMPRFTYIKKADS